MGSEEFTNVQEAFATNWVSPAGPFITLFEEKLAAYCGTKAAAVVHSGTAAIHLALRILNIQQDDVVLCQSFTFVGSSNPILYQKASPIFIDSEKETWNICPLALEEAILACREKGQYPKAIIVVHLYGMPAKMPEIMALSHKYNIPVIEDAAEALGSTINGKACGSFGDFGILSFNGNKIITTGGGGAVVTNNANLAKLAKHLSTTAKQTHTWEFFHDEIGYNYRMPNLNAALGVAQLEQLDERLRLKQRLFERYQKTFDGLIGGKLFIPPDGFNSNNWLVTFILGREYSEDRDKVLQVLNDGGIRSRPVWRLMHRLPMYQCVPRADLTQAEDLETRVLNLPSSAYLGA